MRLWNDIPSGTLGQCTNIHLSQANQGEQSGRGKLALLGKLSVMSEDRDCLYFNKQFQPQLPIGYYFDHVSYNDCELYRSTPVHRNP